MPGKQEYTGWWFGKWIWLSISYMGCHPSHWRTHSYFSRWLIIAPPTSISLWLMILYLILPDTGRSEKNIMGNISRHWDDASLFGVGMEWPQGREQCTISWLFTIRCYNRTMAPWLVNENWWFSYSQDSEDIPRLIYFMDFSMVFTRNCRGYPKGFRLLDQHVVEVMKATESALKDSTATGQLGLEGHLTLAASEPQNSW